MVMPDDESTIIAITAKRLHSSSDLWSLETVLSIFLQASIVAAYVRLSSSVSFAKCMSFSLAFSSNREGRIFGNELESGGL